MKTLITATKNITAHSILLGALMLVSFHGSAASLSSFSIQDETKKDVMAEDSPLSKEAKRLALLGGNARYCKVDKDILEEYMIKSKSRLTGMAKDKYEKIFVSVDFKNLLLSYSIKEPKGSCETVSENVKIFLRTTKNTPS